MAPARPAAPAALSGIASAGSRRSDGGGARPRSAGEPRARFYHEEDSLTTAYRGTILHSLDTERFELRPRGELVVGEDGRIADLADAGRRRRGARTEDRGGRIILPGLVDAHFHIPQIDAVGLSAGPLLEWLSAHIWTAEAECEDPAVARDRARRSFAGLLAAGTTAVAAFSSRHTEATAIALEEAERAGIRAIVGKVLMDREAPAALIEEATGALDDTARLIVRWHGADEGRLGVAVTPRFGISCSDELLAGAGRLAAATGAPVQTHLAENRDEIAALARLFPACADPTEVYERAGLIGPRSILAHCIHLGDGELRRLAERGAVAAHCPSSNFFLHSGRFPLARARAAGLPVSLGTDIGAGTSWSIVDAMQLASFTQSESVDPALLLHLATLGGARALGCEERIGNFLAGKEADFIVVDASDLLGGREPEKIEPRALVSMLVHGSERIRVEEAYVRGAKVR